MEADSKPAHAKSAYWATGESGSDSQRERKINLRPRFKRRTRAPSASVCSRSHTRSAILVAITTSTHVSCRTRATRPAQGEKQGSEDPPLRLYLLDAKPVSISARGDAGMPLKKRAEKGNILVADGVADLLHAAMVAL